MASFYWQQPRTTSPHYVSGIYKQESCPLSLPMPSRPSGLVAH